MATRKGTQNGQGKKGKPARGVDALESDLDALEAAAEAESDGLLDQLEDLDPESLEAEEAAALARGAIGQVEKKKDDPSSLAESITQRHLSVGKQLLADERAFTLDRSMREKVSRFIGRDPGDVRVHTGARAQAAADALGAKAFALGNQDVYFGAGEFSPNSAEGLGVLVHELTHATDNAVGAAFTTGSSQAAYSAAEGRAEAAQAEAEQAARSGQADDPAGRKNAPAKIDLDKLEAAVARLIERESRHMADRTGASGSR